jgi:superfamily II helicase
VRPVNFSKIQENGHLEPINPRLLKNFLIDEKNKFIGFSSQTDPEEFNLIKQMLENFQFDEKNIVYLTFCKSCLEDNKFTILSEKTKIKSLRNQFLCSNCALDIVLKQAQLAGLISSNKINLKSFNFKI